MTKQELLSKAEKMNACWSARMYIMEHKSIEAVDIFDTCSREDWLIWFLAREKRLDRFARVCFNRSEKHWLAGTYYEEYRSAKTAEVATISVEELARRARSTFWFDRVAEEEARQLAGLRRIARAYARGLPAEK